jgi:hypothetical protein
MVLLSFCHATMLSFFPMKIKIKLFLVYKNVCISARSIYLCEAVNKCSLVETAFLLLVTVSMVRTCSKLLTVIISWTMLSCYPI